MSARFKGTINLDDRDSVPDWEPYLQPVAPAGAPSVLYIVLDDVGYSAMEPWGGLIETPNIRKLAERGLTYTNWHTTALCSPTRSSLLTGRNHTTNGMACIAEATTGFPNSNGHIPFECATIRRSRALRQGPQAQVRLQLRRRQGAGDRVDAGRPRAPCDPGGFVRPRR
jgi:sulfatase-like protein